MANVCSQVRVELTISLVRNNSDLRMNFVDPYVLDIKCETELQKN